MRVSYHLGLASRCLPSREEEAEEAEEAEFIQNRTSARRRVVI